ncbi:MAG: fumarylacetoacetate hydrolase family protein, partial [Chloroflexota bacterium]
MIWQLVTFTHKNSKLRIGVIIDDHVLTYPQQHTIADLITNLRDDGDIIPTQTVSRYPLADVNLVSRVVAPLSIRDFYAFEEHVATANRNRGRDVPSQWYEIPVFYFSNPNEVYGDGDIVPYPIGSEKLDYELEVAAVIGKQGRNIAAKDAEHYILGYTIYNDWSARDIQAQEMRVGLGPAKGKDFAQSFGRLLVTPEEIADKRTDRVGVYDLEMVARVNGEERSRGNWQSLHWSFGEMIARASAGVTLYPGDVIGSGTVGTGCLLEVTAGKGPYLQVGDV